MGQPLILGIPGINHEHLTPDEQGALEAAWLEALNQGMAGAGQPAIAADRFRMIHWGPAMEAIEHPTRSPFERVRRLVASPGVHTVLAPLLAPIRLTPTALVVTGGLIVRQWRRAVRSDGARDHVSALVQVLETLDLPPDTARRRTPKAVQWATNVPAVSDATQWLRLRAVVRYREQHARRREMLGRQIEALLGNEPVIVIGHSLGSLVGLQLLLMTPGLPERTVLFLTLGSPLWLSPLHETVLADLQAEIRAVRARGKHHPPRSIRLRHWVNIRDPRDKVAQRVLADCLDERIVDVAVEGTGHDQYELLALPHTAAALANAMAVPAPRPAVGDRRRLLLSA
ncbi:MAG: hypothetical protein R3249_10225 [Nitriliruptorales bacterium]|nr:hypothetical protein [Nitriliruptorales bacterium]